MYVPLPRFLLRAPLLPAAAMARGARALLRHRLGRAAVELASPSLAAAAPGPRRDRALDRYARRAAFRPTPHGLLAGVCMGRLAERTAIATGAPDAWLTPSWPRIEALARLLLDDPELRVRTRLRVAPSAMRGASVIRWIGPGDPFDELHEAELDEQLAAIVSAAGRWTPWAEVRAAAMAPDDDASAADELLLTLLDDGLLASELAPPIIGPTPAAFLAARLAALGEVDAARALDEAAAALATGDLARGRAALATLPGSGDEADLHAVLIHRPAAPPTLERAAVERAARLAPLLVRLQEALAAPAAERFAQPALADGLDAVTELYGAGAFDVAALATGDYGVDVRDDDDDDGGDDGQLPARPPHTGVLAVILDAIATAGARGAVEVSLDPAALTAAVADLAGPRLPCTAELFLSPVPRRRGAAPGTGWLLGLHAPAGASLGRFVHPLGSEALAAIAELEAAERKARPEEIPLDVAFAPSPDLADVAARPASARRRLALTRWGEADSGGGGDDDDELSPAALELVADPSDPAALALRAPGSQGATPVVPASFARLRSTTAPAGIPRLLVGWSLWRQHAPWALPLGPLADLAFVPRLCLDGFVIAPASWRLPHGKRSPETIRRWRRAAGVPRYVQVGQGDELLPVDLAAEGAATDLGDHRRVFEIWPPVDDSALCDRDGRRLEAVVMLIEQPDAADTASHLRWSAAVRAAGAVPPPHRAPASADWTTYKLFGPAARQDDLLTSLVPIVRAGQHADEIDRWFFQRYIDGPGHRHHLRLRVRARADGAAFARRLRNRLHDARAAAVLTGITVDEYHPEHGRFRANELDAVFTLFESDSELAVTLSPSNTEPWKGSAPPAMSSGGQSPPTLDAGPHAIDPVVLFVRACDALACGLGLDLDARHALAKQRRHAAEASAALLDDDRAHADAGFRGVGRGLRVALLADAAGDSGGDTDPHAAALAAHRARVAHAARDLSRDARARLLPTLLHLSAVRCMGPHPDRERLAYTFWERTLAGMRRPAGGGGRAP